jgi:hypothetical protein
MMGHPSRAENQNVKMKAIRGGRAGQLSWSDRESVVSEDM